MVVSGRTFIEKAAENIHLDPQKAAEQLGAADRLVRPPYGCSVGTGPDRGLGERSLCVTTVRLCSEVL
jgi:hypothetical protein